MAMISGCMQEWILQIPQAHNERVDKLREICQKVYSGTKKEDVATKANNCPTYFKTSKNLLTRSRKPKTAVISYSLKKGIANRNRGTYIRTLRCCITSFLVEYDEVKHAA